MKTPTFRTLATAIVCATAALACGAQQQPAAPASPTQDDAPVLRVTSRTVDIATVVRDKAGDPQRSLTRDDFTLKVDGREVPIQHFTIASDLPLTLALLVDVSGSQRTFVTDEWRASDVFFQSMLTRPQDRALLVEVDARARLLADLTNSPNRLHLALTQLGSNPSTSGATLLNDTVFVIAKDVLSRERGRKAIVLLSDGGDNGSRHSIDQAIEQAQRANISIYSVEYSAWAGPEVIGRSGYGLSDPGEVLLKRLAESTGGQVYRVSHTMPLQRIYESIANDLRTQYELGYTPPSDLKPNSFHKIEVRTKDKALLVQARKGFYVQP